MAQDSTRHWSQCNENVYPEPSLSVCSLLLHKVNKHGHISQCKQRVILSIFQPGTQVNLVNLVSLAWHFLVDPFSLGLLGRYQNWLKIISVIQKREGFLSTSLAGTKMSGGWCLAHSSGREKPGARASA